MTEKDKSRNKKFGVAQLTVLFVGVANLLIASILFGLSIEGFPYFFLGVFFSCGFAEVVLAIIRCTKNRIHDGKTDSWNGSSSTKDKPSPNKNHRSYSYYGQPQYQKEPPKRAIKDELIKKMDDFVSSEYPDLPLDSFNIPVDVNFDSGYLAYLRRASYEMQKHLGIEKYIITITVIPIPYDANSTKREVGHFKRTGLLTAEIEVDADLPTAKALACLAHEMSHAYQNFKGKKPFSTDDSEEQFTDLLTYYLGFAELIKKGYYSFNSKLGYVEDGDFSKIEEIYSERTSSRGSFKTEKKNLKDYIKTYKDMIEQLLVMCDAISNKYMPSDDKEYVLKLKEKYSSQEISDYLAQISDNVEKRAKIQLNMDQIGIEMKIEELIADKQKLQNMYDFVNGTI